MRFNIIGTHTCETSRLLATHYDADEARANRIRFENGGEGVFCVFCGVALPSTVEALLNGSGRRVVPIHLGTARQFRYSFNFGDNCTALLTFFDRNEFQLAAEDIGRAYDSNEFSALPESIDKVARALAACGYRVTSFPESPESQKHHLRTIIMVRGRRLFPSDPEKTAIQGPLVELSYIVGDTYNQKW